MIHINRDTPLDVAIEELAGMAARRIAISQSRAAGISWSLSRKTSLNAVADQTIKNQIREALNQGMEPKDAVHAVVERNK